MTAGTCGQADPAFSSRVGRAVREEQGPGRLAAEDARQGLGPGPRGDDHRASRLGHQPRRSQLALHAAGPHRAPLRLGHRQDLVVDLGHQRDDFRRRRGIRVRPIQPIDHAQDDQQGAWSRFVTMAASRSLSPNLISSTLIVSFSLITGTALHSKRAFNVFRMFR